MGSRKLIIEEEKGFTTVIKEFWELKLLICFHITNPNPEVTLSLSLHGLYKERSHASCVGSTLPPELGLSMKQTAQNIKKIVFMSSLM
jgi:hypothetical protein